MADPVNPRGTRPSLDFRPRLGQDNAMHALGSDVMSLKSAGLAAWINDHPRAAFAVFCVLHIAIWTLVPSVLYPNLPLDLIEARTYGPQWQFGYDKLPPMPWWLVEIMYRLIGTDWSYYLLSQVVVVAAFAIVWLAALPLVGAAGALASVLIVDGLHYFNFTAAKFNHDVVQLPFWALAAFALHRALRNGRLGSWALVGAALGFAFSAKYFIVMLAVPMALFVLIDPAARRSLRTSGPYVAIAVGLLVALPHLIWLVANDFLPLAYAEARLAPARGVLDHLTRPAIFVLGQVFWLIPSLLIAVPLLYPRTTTPLPPADPRDRRFWTVIVFGPAVLLIAGGIVSGDRLITMWGYPFWLFLGLWLVLRARVALERPRLVRIVAIWGIVTAAYVLAFVADYAVLPFIGTRYYRASLFPGDRLAAEITDRFRSATGAPLRYVIADIWLGGNIHQYGATHPLTVIDGKPARVPWIDPADVRARGAAVVWTGDDRTNLPDAYATIAQRAQVQAPFDLPMRWGRGSIKVGWAIIPPER
jgi:Dolichyl-phosphate-mannose-protein mannosyltransferase